MPTPTTDRFPRLLRLPAAVLVVTGAAAAADCSRRDEAEWLRGVLLEENRAFLERDPDAVRDKFDRMSRDPFSYMRGSLAVFVRETRERAKASAYATDATSGIALLGDPHLENVGTYQTGDGSWVIELNDFDRTRYGPYVDDVRRLAASFFVAANDVGIPAAERSGISRSAVRGYVAEIRGLAAGAPPVRIRPDANCGRICRELFSKAMRPAKKPAPGTPPKLPKGDALSAEDLARITRLLAAYPATLAHAGHAPAAFTLKHAVGRRSGVSSRAHLRYRVVVEGPTPASDDDWVLDVKEIREGRAEQAVAMQRSFHEHDDSDVLLGWAKDGDLSFLVREYERAQRRFGVAPIAKGIREGTWSRGDLQVLARDTGRLVARGHALTPGRDGRRGLRALAAAVGTGDGFVREMTAFAETFGKRTLTDYGRFKALLAKHGPLLGWRPGAPS